MNAISGRLLKDLSLSFGNYYLTTEGRVGGVWVRECACGYQGKLDDRGWLGFHCPRCGVKLLNQENPWV